MSAERPEAGVPEQPSADGSVAPDPEVAARLLARAGANGRARRRAIAP